MTMAEWTPQGQRTAQFLIERPCPGTPGCSVPLPGQAPFPVWVYLQPEQSDLGWIACGATRVFRITEESIEAHGIITPTTGWPAVCEHMGHLIE